LSREQILAVLYRHELGSYQHPERTVTRGPQTQCRCGYWYRTGHYIDHLADMLEEAQ